MVDKMHYGMIVAGLHRDGLSVSLAFKMKQASQALFRRAKRSSTEPSGTKAIETGRGNTYSGIGKQGLGGFDSDPLSPGGLVMPQHPGPPTFSSAGEGPLGNPAQSPTWKRRSWLSRQPVRADDGGPCPDSGRTLALIPPRAPGQDPAAARTRGPAGAVPGRTDAGPGSFDI